MSEPIEIVKLTAPMQSVHDMQQRGAFRRVELVFRMFMRTYPKPLEVPCPANITPGTLANRLREGAKALLYHRWPQSFSLDEFEAAWKATCIRKTAAGTLVIGLKAEQLSSEEPVSFAAASKSNAGQVIERIDDEEVLRCLMFLHHRNVFKTHTHIQSLKAELATWLEEMLKADALKGWDKKDWSLDFRRHPSEPGWILG